MTVVPCSYCGDEVIRAYKRPRVECFTCKLKRRKEYRNARTK